MDSIDDVPCSKEIAAGEAGKQCLTGKPEQAISHDQEIEAAFRARASVHRSILDRLRGKPPKSRIVTLPATRGLGVTQNVSKLTALSRS
jgi:hypothetical protein